MENAVNSLGPQSIFSIGGLSEIGVVRRAGNLMAQSQGFSELRAGELALVITEAATNISKHAQQGTIYLRMVSRGSRKGIEMLAVDKGPGMVDLPHNMQDGRSSTGTYGVGLGTIQRLSSELEIYTAPGKGCVLMALVWDDVTTLESTDWQVGAMCIPLPSEDVCGDGWANGQDEQLLNILLADGLGHGPEAAIASNLATNALNHYPQALPARMMQHCHDALRGSRGAAVAIAQINTDTDEIRFAGVGNIAASFYHHDKRQHLISSNGIVGSNLPRVREYPAAWQPDSTLILHSDGITTHWDLEQYPGLKHSHPSLIAAVLFRDFCRGRDDGTVVVVKDQRERV